VRLSDYESNRKPDPEEAQNTIVLQAEPHGRGKLGGGLRLFLFLIALTLFAGAVIGLVAWLAWSRGPRATFKKRGSSSSSLDHASRRSLNGAIGRLSYTRSSTMAMPMPPEMHKVASPSE
jgi:hypothetical protein